MLIKRCAAFFFFNDTATTEIYTLSLHDALPICSVRMRMSARLIAACGLGILLLALAPAPIGDLRGFTAESAKVDRKSTRLNSSHLVISYAVFCLKKNSIRSYALERVTHSAYTYY